MNPSPESEFKPHLTEREHEVIEQLCKGRLNKEIADHLGIAVQTVNAHVHTVLRKLGARNRLEAARLYAELLPRNADTGDGKAKAIATVGKAPRPADGQRPRG